MIELVVLIEVGRLIGALATVAALLLIAVVGALVMRRAGAAAWHSLNRSLRAGEPPSRELANAAVLVLSGFLLIIPGFVTDLFALLVILPLSRPLARRPLERMFRRAAADRVTLLRVFPGGATAHRSEVIEGEIVEE